jgi:hypothetical protein
MTDTDTVTIYDFAWDDGGDLGVWVLDGDKAVLVEASVNERGEQELDEDGDPLDSDERHWVQGEPTGEHVLPSGELPVGAGVLLPEHREPVFGAAARQAWARLFKLAAERPMIDNGRGAGGVTGYQTGF